MTDRELLEQAAKAAGIDVRRLDWPQPDRWSPLTDDGDAFRLAVALGMQIIPYPLYSPEKHSVEVARLLPAPPRADQTLIGPQLVEIYKRDPFAATRRAIVRAAAEIGKGLP